MMKLSLTLEPGTSFASDCATAKRLGFDGVFVRPGTDLARFSTGLSTIREGLASAGLQVIGLQSTSLWSGDGNSSDAQECVRCHKLVDIAAALGCGLIGPVIGVSAASRSASLKVAPFRQWALPLGAYAHENGVRILMGNQGLFGTARILWAVLDQMPHDTFGCDWDLNAGIAANDPPAIAVPMLNLRLSVVRLTVDLDADDTHQRTALQAVHRLAGIGFNGYLNLEAFLLMKDNSIEREAYLARAVERVRKWTGSGPKAAVAEAHKKAPAAASASSKSQG